MNTQALEIADRLKEIFFPFAVERTNELVKRKGRFVHYTSAANAINIFNSKQVWLRSARSMNDFMEVEHGFEYLLDYFQKNENKNRQALYDASDAFCKGAAESSGLINGCPLFDTKLISDAFRSTMTTKMHMGGCRCGVHTVARQSESP